MFHKNVAQCYFAHQKFHKHKSSLELDPLCGRTCISRETNSPIKTEMADSVYVCGYEVCVGAAANLSLAINRTW
jgi:hypothetical protein